MQVVLRKATGSSYVIEELPPEFVGGTDHGRPVDVPESEQELVFSASDSCRL
jgi:hypothetical protein